jgi:hypothetical protein
MRLHFQQGNVALQEITNGATNVGSSIDLFTNSDMSHLSPTYFHVEYKQGKIRVKIRDSWTNTTIPINSEFTPGIYSKRSIELYKVRIQLEQSNESQQEGNNDNNKHQKSSGLDTPLLHWLVAILSPLFAVAFMVLLCGSCGDDVEKDAKLKQPAVVPATTGSSVTGSVRFSKIGNDVDTDTLIEFEKVWMDISSIY